VYVLCCETCNAWLVPVLGESAEDLLLPEMSKSPNSLKDIVEEALARHKNHLVKAVSEENMPSTCRWM
jgi:hypothetical protein